MVLWVKILMFAGEDGWMDGILMFDDSSLQ